MDIPITEVSHLNHAGAALSQHVRTASIDSKEVSPVNNGNFTKFDPRLVNTEINNTMLNTFNGSFMASHSKKMSNPASKSKSVRRD